MIEIRTQIYFWSQQQHKTWLNLSQNNMSSKSKQDEGKKYEGEMKGRICTFLGGSELVHSRRRFKLELELQMQMMKSYESKQSITEISSIWTQIRLQLRK